MVLALTHVAPAEWRTNGHRRASLTARAPARRQRSWSKSYRRPASAFTRKQKRNLGQVGVLGQTWGNLPQQRSRTNDHDLRSALSASSSRRSPLRHRGGFGTRRLRALARGRFRGDLRDRLGEQWLGAGQFNYPHGIAVDAHGHVYSPTPATGGSRSSRATAASLANGETSAATPVSSKIPWTSPSIRRATTSTSPTLTTAGSRSSRAPGNSWPAGPFWS